MQTSFNDLVGDALVPAHCLASAELTDLTPALDPMVGVVPQSSEAAHSSDWGSYCCADRLA
jgi:hypothetical protein